MNVSLTAELEAFVEEAVKSGRYASASEAVREGLRLLQEREAKFLRLKRDIEDGLASGEATEGSLSALAGRLRSKWDREQAVLAAGASNAPSGKVGLGGGDSTELAKKLKLSQADTDAV